MTVPVPLSTVVLETGWSPAPPGSGPVPPGAGAPESGAPAGWFGGFAEYVSYSYRKLNYDAAIAQAANRTYPLS
ncbi:hypothetical protein ABZZ04_39330, partial [Streptomyces sp. NPDC006435]|uniref:hypothetical protein n=1 Tax=Streptomyces sp. NPDC006435 TaxID=3154300 RepID=UPI0033B36AD3